MVLIIYKYQKPSADHDHFAAGVTLTPAAGLLTTVLRKPVTASEQCLLPEQLHKQRYEPAAEKVEYRVDYGSE